MFLSTRYVLKTLRDYLPFSRTTLKTYHIKYLYGLTTNNTTNNNSSVAVVIRKKVGFL